MSNLINDTMLFDYSSNPIYPITNISAIKIDGYENEKKLDDYPIYKYVKDCIDNETKNFNFVDLETDQEINGNKTFKEKINGTITNAINDSSNNNIAESFISVNNKIDTNSNSIVDIYSKLDNISSVDLSNYSGKFNIDTTISNNPAIIKGNLEVYDTLIAYGPISAPAFYEESDERLKTFKSAINIDLDKLSKIKKSHFIFNERPTIEHIGVSAQEIKDLYPEIVVESDSGILKVDYSKLSVIALAAIDVLYKENLELKNRLDILESKLK